MHQIASDFSKFSRGITPGPPLAAPIYLLASHTSFHFETSANSFSNYGPLH